MSVKEEFEKMRAKRVALEEESRLLVKRQETLEKSVVALEEQFVQQELKKERALVEDLRSRNEAVKKSIAEMEAKKGKLESKLSQITQTSESAPEKQEAGGSSAKSKKEAEVVEDQEGQKKKKRRFF